MVEEIDMREEVSAAADNAMMDDGTKAPENFAGDIVPVSWAFIFS